MAKAPTLGELPLWLAAATTWAWRSHNRDPVPVPLWHGVHGFPDHAMVCTGVAKMTQMRHDIVASAVRRVVCLVCSLESSISHLRASTQQGNMVGLYRVGVLSSSQEWQTGPAWTLWTPCCGKLCRSSCDARAPGLLHKREEGKKRAFQRHDAALPEAAWGGRLKVTVALTRSAFVRSKDTARSVWPFSGATASCTGSRSLRSLVQVAAASCRG